MSHAKPAPTTTQQPGEGSTITRRREEILQQAIRLFAEHGYGGTDTQMLADQLKVGKGTLYRYFPSKEELFLAAADYVMRKLRDYVLSYVEAAADPFDQIERGIRGYLVYFAEHPEFVELLIQERALFKDRREPTYFLHRERNAQRWRDLYRELIAAGQVRNMPPERISDVVSRLLYGTMFTNYFSRQQPDFEKQTLEILDVILHGILSDSERQRRAAGDGSRQDEPSF
jgi:AcrR family transcriptional regulator